MDYDKKIPCDKCGTVIEKSDGVEFVSTGRFLCEPCYDSRERGES